MNSKGSTMESIMLPLVTIIMGTSAYSYSSTLEVQTSENLFIIGSLQFLVLPGDFTKGQTLCLFWTCVHIFLLFFCRFM